MRLDTGSMDNVQTQPDVLPALKKVLFRVVEPSDPAKVQQEYKDGKIKAVQFTVQIEEPTPYVIERAGENVKRDAQNRVLSFKANWYPAT